jgi:hypothetical protein
MRSPISQRTAKTNAKAYNDYFIANNPMKKTKRGGKRKGAGRPKKAETKTVSFRVELNKVEPLKKLVAGFLKPELTYSCEKCKKKYKLVADAILCCSGW